MYTLYTFTVLHIKTIHLVYRVALHVHIGRKDANLTKHLNKLMCQTRLKNADRGIVPPLQEQTFVNL